MLLLQLALLVELLRQHLQLGPVQALQQSSCCCGVCGSRTAAVALMLLLLLLANWRLWLLLLLLLHHVLQLCELLKQNQCRTAVACP